MVQTMPENTLFTCLTEEDETSLRNPVDSVWNQTDVITIDRFWTGAPAIEQKGCGWTNLTQVSSLWNQHALFFHFKCWYSWDGLSDGSESESASLLLKPAGCQDYFEWSVSSQGTLSATRITKPAVEVDTKWDSGAMAWVRFSEVERIWRAVLRMSYRPLFPGTGPVAPPEVGDAWRLDLRRTAGSEQEREFLSWCLSPSNVEDIFLFGHLIFLGEA